MAFSSRRASDPYGCMSKCRFQRMEWHYQRGQTIVASCTILKTHSDDQCLDVSRFVIIPGSRPQVELRSCCPGGCSRNMTALSYRCSDPHVDASTVAAPALLCRSCTDHVSALPQLVSAHYSDPRHWTYKRAHAVRSASFALALCSLFSLLPFTPSLHRFVLPFLAHFGPNRLSLL